MSRVFFRNYCLQETAEDIFSYCRCGEKGETGLNFFSVVSSGCKRRNLLFYFVENCQHADKNQLVQRQTFALDIDSAHGQPTWYRARPTSMEDDLEHTGDQVNPWSRGRELAGGVLRSSPEPGQKFFFLANRDGSRILSSVLCAPATDCFS